VDFDPKGMFNKKKNEPDDSNYTQRTTEKKKEHRKSIRNNHKTDQKKKSSVKDLFKLLDDQSIQAAGSRLEEIVQSFQKELNYQNELLEYMKEESILLRRKLQEESEKCASILELFEAEIASVRKITDEERRERRQVQITLENLQTTISIPPSPNANAAATSGHTPNTAATKNPSKKETKTKRTQKKKPNNPN